MNIFSTCCNSFVKQLSFINSLLNSTWILKINPLHKCLEKTNVMNLNCKASNCLDLQNAGNLNEFSKNYISLSYVNQQAWWQSNQEGCLLFLWEENKWKTTLKETAIKSPGLYACIYKKQNTKKSRFLPIIFWLQSYIDLSGITLT